VPIPFQEIAAAGAARQGRYDKKIMELESMQAQADMMQGKPGADTDYLNNEFRPALDRLTEKYLQEDLSTPLVQSNLARDFKQNINRRQVNAIQQSHAGYMDYMKQYTDMKAKGLLAPDVIQQDPSTHSTIEEGVFMDAPISALDYASFADDYFKNLGDTYFGVEVIDGLPVMTSGINKARIKDAADKGVDSFLNDPRGRQYVAIQQASGNKGTDQQIAEEYLYTRGLAFTQKRAQQVSGWDPNPKTPPLPFSGTDNTQYTVNPSRMPSKEVKTTYGFDPTKVEDPKDIYDIFDFDDYGMLSTDLKDRPGLKSMTDVTRSA
jgi:hypothetical protein